MAGFRAERIAELVHRELAVRLHRDFKDPRFSPISITRVDVSKDLSRALVHYLPLGGGESTAELKEALASAAKQLRGPVGRALGIRHAPEIVFAHDTHTEAAIRVTSLLDRLKDPAPEGPDEAHESTTAPEET
jgi:ribosome-binding factor A